RRHGRRGRVHAGGNRAAVVQTAQTARMPAAGAGVPVALASGVAGTLLPQALNGIFTGSIYALFAVGYTLVFGVLDVLNLAHSAVFMLGAVIAYSLVVLHGQSFFLAAVLAVAASGLLGLVIEYVALRPLRRRNAPQISALISTIGLALIFVAVVEQAKPGSPFAWLWIDGPNSVRFPVASVPNPTWHFARLTLGG